VNLLPYSFIWNLAFLLILILWMKGICNCACKENFYSPFVCSGLFLTFLFKFYSLNSFGIFNL
jgi:hypothetical protein